MKIQKPGREPGPARTLTGVSIGQWGEQRREWRDIPAEDEAQREEQVGNVAARLGQVGAGDDHVGKGAGEHQKHPDEQEHERLALRRLARGDGVVVQADGVVPAGVDEDGHERVPGQLDEDVGHEEGLPAVALAGPLARLVQRALHHEVGHDLLHQVAEDGEEHEDAEHLVLQALQRRGRAVEAEADEQRRQDGQRRFRVDVRRRAPVLREDAQQTLPQLRGEGRRELAVAGLVRGQLAGSHRPQARQLLGELVELAVHFGYLRAVAPHLRPVDVGVGARRGADDLEHPLGRVGLGRAGRRAVALEVVGHGAAAGADLAKVDGAAALGQEEQAVEALEQHGARLVDGEQDGLAVAREFFHQVADGPAGLAVEARRRLVEEQQQLRLGRHLDADGQALALLDVEALAGHADHGVGVVLHLEQLDDLLDVVQFRAAADVGGLAQQRGELQALAHGRGLQVQVLLLHVARLALEARVARAAVDQHGARDDADGGARGQHVEQRRLARAGLAHQRRHDARPHPAVDAVQQPPLAALDLDVEAHVLPVEHGLLLLNRGHRRLARQPLLALLRRLGRRRRGAAGLDVDQGPGLVHVTATEEQHLALGLGGRDVLGGDEVGGAEEDGKGVDDAEVAPQVLGIVVEAERQVAVAVDVGLARDAADGGADLAGRRHAGVGRARRALGHVGGAGEAAVVELVDHEALEGVGDGVDVVDPAEPDAHAAEGQREARVDHEREQDDGGGRERLGQGARRGADGAEDHGHGQGDAEGEEQEGEEGARGAAQVGEEVEGQVEGDGVEHLGRQVAQHGRDGLGEGVVEGVARVLLDDGALRVQGQDLEVAGEGVEQDGEEEQGAAAVEAAAVVEQVVEDGADDEGHGEVADGARQHERHVAAQPLEAALHADADLAPHGERVGRAHALRARLLRLARRDEALQRLAADGVLEVEGVDGVHEPRVVGALLPARHELVGRAWRGGLEARAHHALGGAGQRGQEVGGGLALRAGEAQPDEEGLGLGGGAKVDLAPLVQHGDLVEDVVDALRGLVDGQAGGGAVELGRQAQGAAELEGVGAVEAAGAVVPALQRAAAERGLGDADALALAAADAAHEVVADLGVLGVAQAERGHDHVLHVLGVHVTADAREAVGRRARLGRELERLADGHLREVHLGLGHVDGLAAEVVVHALGRDALVVEVRVAVHVQAVGLAGDGLEEGGAAAAGAAEHHEHLAAAHDAGEVAQDLDALLAGAEGPAGQRAHRQHHVGHVLLVVGGGAEAVHAEAAEGHAGGAGRVAGRVARADGEHELEPLPRAEGVAVRVERRVVAGVEEGVLEVGQGRMVGSGRGVAEGLGGQLAGQAADLVRALGVDLFEIVRRLDLVELGGGGGGGVLGRADLAVVVVGIVAAGRAVAVELGRVLHGRVGVDGAEEGGHGGAAAMVRAERGRTASQHWPSRQMRERGDSSGR